MTTVRLEGDEFLCRVLGKMVVLNVAWKVL